MNENTARLKKEKLIRYLKGLDSLLVAFSGGVDSTFLLALAHETLGDKVLAVTESSSTYPSMERQEAVQFAKRGALRMWSFNQMKPVFPSLYPIPRTGATTARKPSLKNL